VLEGGHHRSGLPRLEPERVDVHPPVLVHRHGGDVQPRRLEPAEGAEDDRMLHGPNDRSAVPARRDPRKRERHRLRAAGREDDLVGIGRGRVGDRLPGFGQVALRCATPFVEAEGVTEAIQGFFEGSAGRGRQRR
jgi:hypothetical protein